MLKYGLPRAVLIKMLDRPGALEYEIASWLSDRAIQRARERLAADEGPPAGDDLFSRAVRGVYAQLEAQRDAAEEADRMRRYRETDALLARIKAGEDVEL